MTTGCVVPQLGDPGSVFKDMREGNPPLRRPPFFPLDDVILDTPEGF